MWKLSDAYYQSTLDKCKNMKKYITLYMLYILIKAFIFTSESIMQPMYTGILTKHIKVI